MCERPHHYTKVDRVGAGINYDVTARGKRSIAVDMKDPRGAQIVKRLCSKSDVLIEPFRSGVMEKLGLGPKVLTRENPKLIYARLTGYGQAGPYAKMAGHDINYLATSGVLSRLGRRSENPYAPVNLLADFAGGSFVCALGILAALVERSVSGKGQVIDANMVEGAAYVSSWLFKSQKKLFVWGEERGRNALDGGAPFYDTYKTKDGKYMAVGALEPKFYAEFVKRLGDVEEELDQFNQNVDEFRAKLCEIFKRKTREEWTRTFDGTDACVTPVVELDEAPVHPHNKFRESFVPDLDGEHSPVPAPRLSRTPGKAEVSRRDPEIGENSVEIAKECRYSDDEIESFLSSGVLYQADIKSSKL